LSPKEQEDAQLQQVQQQVQVPVYQMAPMATAGVVQQQQQQFETRAVEKQPLVEQEDIQPTLVQPLVAEDALKDPVDLAMTDNAMANAKQEELLMMEPPPDVPATAEALPFTNDQPMMANEQQTAASETMAVEAPPEAADKVADTEDPTTKEATTSTTATTPNDESSSGKLFPFDSILSTLQRYKSQYNTTSIPTSHPTFIKIISELVTNGIEDEADKLWECNFDKLKEYKERVGDCDVPFAEEGVGSWVVQQRKLYARLHAADDANNEEDGKQQQQKQQKPIDAKHADRFERLTSLNFDFSTPMWDLRLQQLRTYKSQHNHVSPPVSYEKLGIWVINQRFNIKDICEERQRALDGVGFVWNHNRKNRSQERWDSRYEELLEYIKVHGHCNVPATYRHSPLGTWVGKQREEYKKLKDKKSSQLDKYRIDKLNEVEFQWSLQSWTVISWDDRFEALKKFKGHNGHVKVPRNHPDFGNWPIYQKAQYKLFKEGKKSKITKEKVDRLIQIGFFESPNNSQAAPSLSEQANAAMAVQKQQGGGYDAGEIPLAMLKQGGGYDAGTYDWNHHHQL